MVHLAFNASPPWRSVALSARPRHLKSHDFMFVPQGLLCVSCKSRAASHISKVKQKKQGVLLARCACSAHCECVLVMNSSERAVLLCGLLGGAASWDWPSKFISCFLWLVQMGGQRGNVSAPAFSWAHYLFSLHSGPSDGVAIPSHLGDPEMAGFMEPFLAGDMGSRSTN